MLSRRSRFKKKQILAELLRQRASPPTRPAMTFFRLARAMQEVDAPMLVEVSVFHEIIAEA